MLQLFSVVTSKALQMSCALRKIIPYPYLPGFTSFTLFFVQLILKSLLPCMVAINLICPMG